MRTVYKYPLELLRDQTVELPMGYEIVLVGHQDGSLCIWAEVETDNPLQDTKIRINGTGHIVEDYLDHIGSVQIPPMVWHLYRVKYNGRPC